MRTTYLVVSLNALLFCVCSCGGLLGIIETTESTDELCDSGICDSGATPDTSQPDVSQSDTADSEIHHDSEVDSGIAESGIPDTLVESGTPDTGTPDTGTPDTGTPDTGTPDTGTPDTGTPDSGTPDTGTPDTGVVDAADSGPVWTPLDLNALILWLDPANGLVGSPIISQWTDRSPSAIVLTSPTIDRRPQVDSFDGHPAVRFASNHPWCSLLTADNTVVGKKLDFGVENVLFAAVVKSNQVVDINMGGVFYKADLAVSPFKGMQLYTNGSSANGRPAGGLFGGSGLMVSDLGATDDGHFHLITVVRLDKTLVLRFDGIQLKSLSYAIVDVYDTNRPLSIGNRNDCIHGYNGLVGDVVVVRGPDVDSLNKVEAYLKGKYGIN